MLSDFNQPEVFWLYLLSGVFMLAVPTYKHLRNRMVEDDPEEQSPFSRGRILKIIGTNLFLSLVAGIICLNVFLTILNNQSPNPLILILFIFIIILTAYGSGIYISFITLEEFIPPKIRNAKFFEIPFSTIKFLHGPISHLLIHSGAILALLFLAIIEASQPNGPEIDPRPLLILGGLVGLFYASAWVYSVLSPKHITEADLKIYNQSSFYQLPVNLIALIGFLILVLKKPASLNCSPVGAYFLGAITTFNLAIIIRLIIRKKKNGKIH